MRQSENSKLVPPSTEIAKEKLQQLNKAAKKFEDWTGYDSVKEDVDLLLLGWISGDAMEYHAIYRAEIFSFFTDLLIQIKKIYGIDESKVIEFYDWLFNLNRKKVKFYFKSTLTAFIESDYANDKAIRTRIHYDIVELQLYIEKMYKINTKWRLKLNQN